MQATDIVKLSCETLIEMDEIFDEETADETLENRPAIQYPDGRTYGECVEDEKHSIRMINGRFVPTIRIKDKPLRLPRAEAMRYYKQKLRKAWITPSTEKGSSTGRGSAFESKKPTSNKCQVGRDK